MPSLCSSLSLISHLSCSFKNIQDEKHKFFPQGPFFKFCRETLYRSTPILKNFPCSDKHSGCARVIKSVFTFREVQNKNSICSNRRDIFRFTLLPLFISKTRCHQNIFPRLFINERCFVTSSIVNVLKNTGILQLGCYKFQLFYTTQN